MEAKDAISAFAALAQDTRLDALRLLIRVGPNGLPAGRIASALGVTPSTLSFHLGQLERAGLLTKRRRGREQLASGDVEAVRSVSSMLAELEQLWRGRIDRIVTFLEEH